MAINALNICFSLNSGRAKEGVGFCCVSGVEDVNDSASLILFCVLTLMDDLPMNRFYGHKRGMNEFMKSIQVCEIKALLY